MEYLFYTLVEMVKCFLYSIAFIVFVYILFRVSSLAILKSTNQIKENQKTNQRRRK